MIAYLFKTILCSAVFLLVYSLFLEREKMYRFNRFYLLGSIILSLLIPLVTITVEKDTPLQTINEFVFSPENTLSEAAPLSNAEPMPTYFDTDRMLMFIYWLVTAFFLVILMTNLYKLYTKILRVRLLPYKGSHLVLIEEELTAHSFLNYIFLNKMAYEEGRIEKEILHHELTHAKQAHTIDILIIEFISAFLWFNPFIFLFKRAIKLNHEFLADESVVNEFQNVTAYQSLLLGKTNQKSALAVTSQFNFLITKKRLIMITKYTSRRKAILKQSFALLMITAAIVVFSSKVILAQEVDESMLQGKQLTTKLLDPTNPEDTTKPAWRNFYPGGTEEGVSMDLLNEYHNIINRNKKADMNWLDFRKDIPGSDRQRLEEIFLQMSLLQQQHEKVIFMKPMRPLPRIVPTQKQFNSFKNPKVYGIWVNKKKVTNSVLNKYTAKDFSHVFISKLYGAAKKGRSYSYQVDLMTNSYFQTSNDQLRADKSNRMLFQFHKPISQ